MENENNDPAAPADDAVPPSAAATNSNNVGDDEDVLAVLNAFEDTDGLQPLDNRSAVEKCRDEVSRFIGEAVLPFKVGNDWANPLKWWQLKQQVCPRLSKLAKIVLAIPATSAPTERIFSKATNVLSKKRAGLTAENAGMCVFLQGNLDMLDENGN